MSRTTWRPEVKLAITTEDPYEFPRGDRNYGFDDAALAAAIGEEVDRAARDIVESWESHPCISSIEVF